MSRTELGKELKKIRVVNREVLFDMASRIGMSSAMLSAIETGAKQAPDDFIDRLAVAYPTVAENLEHFKQLAELTKKHVKLMLDGDEKTNRVMLAFARSGHSLTMDQLDLIWGMLTNNSKDTNVTTSKIEVRNR